MDKFKVIVVGGVGVGKTSIIRRYTKGIFLNYYKSTIGVDFCMKNIKIGDNIINLNLWDIAGQERFANMTRVYYKDAIAAIVVFDISNLKSLEVAAKWKRDIENKVLNSINQKPIPVFLFANKCDNKKDTDDIKDLLSIFVDNNGFVGWQPTSAKYDYNIDEAFKILLKYIIENVEYKVETKKTDIFKIEEKQESRNCCF